MLASLFTTVALVTFTFAHDILHSRASAPKANVISACKAPKTVALTFDDGPYIYLPSITKMLDDAGAKGTFFFNGDNYGCIYSQENMANIKAAFKSGHQVASHSWSHPDFQTLTPAQMMPELTKMNTAFKRILGVVPAYFRPPYGNYNDDTRRAAKAQNQTLVIWDFDAGDADDQTPKQSIARYNQSINKQKPQTLLALNHEVKEETANEVLPYALAQLKKNNWKMVTVAECLGGTPDSAYQYIGKPATFNAGTWKC
ncbi:carbohydrate esterase family 4 protein [Mycena floridula]|nr:carbohydrate esterase family 4 protein [Mycena floridula]